MSAVDPAVPGRVPTTTNRLRRWSRCSIPRMRCVAEEAVRTVHQAASHGEAFAAITILGFVGRNLDANEAAHVGY